MILFVHSIIVRDQTDRNKYEGANGVKNPRVPGLGNNHDDLNARVLIISVDLKVCELK
jgi:hypothetical protein